MPDGLSESPPIDDIPEITRYPQIIDAAKSGKLVLFVGAGVSRLAGGRSWEDAANTALNQLIKEEVITYGEKEQLKNEHPKKKLSIAINISEGSNTRLGFEEIFIDKNSFIPDAQIFQDLYSINVPIVTTNYDDGLDFQAKKPPKSPPDLKGGDSQEKEVITRGRLPVYYHREDLTINRLMEPGAVIHLHGGWKEPASMVISTSQYLDHYRDETVQTFLNGLFAENYTVLFIGYGLEEEEIVEYVILKTLKKRPGGQQVIEHYWLYPGLTFQSARFKHLSNYYLKHCNVQTIGFSIDQIGHPQLEKVISQWAEQLRRIVRTPDFLDKISLIDEVL